MLIIAMTSAKLLDFVGQCWTVGQRLPPPAIVGFCFATIVGYCFSLLGRFCNQWVKLCRSASSHTMLFRNNGGQFETV
ncbi:MAG: hypothetical protein A2341_06670 [Deltaproteobacteria bacterium RIFOXYB12_FULL_58_9]|nr:MAG: hypothetical protein A2341_06670 [Deltaproteobacteria bacterium RIFOXYB12_FULL_58_9]